MNAVICLRSLPLTIFGGVFAITTSTPALIKFVHQSFSPLRIKAEPSSVGSARRLMFAGSEPAFHSVSANAEISLARHSRQIFLLLLFRAEEQQRLRNADRLMRGNERGQVRVPTTEQHRSATVIHLRQTEAAVLLSEFSRRTRPSRKVRRCFSAGFRRCDRSHRRRRCRADIFSARRGTLRLWRDLLRSAPGKGRCGRNRIGR